MGMETKKPVKIRENSGSGLPLGAIPQCDHGMGCKERWHLPVSSQVELVPGRRSQYVTPEGQACG